MQKIKFDFNNMFSLNIGNKHGVELSELNGVKESVTGAHKHLKRLIEDPISRVKIGLEWVRLPFLGSDIVKEIQGTGRKISKKYDNVISLGIGGSYLGIKAAQDALCPPYYNEFDSLRKGKSKIYFEGNNLDPVPLKALLKSLNPKKTFVIVISKSGETTETKVAFAVVESWLKKAVGKTCGRQIFAITDPVSGTLRKKVTEAQKRDKLSLRDFPLLKGVGGRFSELNIGLLHLAIAGINIQDLLLGARAMAERCGLSLLHKNPAMIYALLNTILYRKKGKSISIMMPFSETLKSTADWYVQLLAESLGKKFQRKIEIDQSGIETWAIDKKRVVNTGRTPIPCRGTNDLHSIHQNNTEGENNKVVTFIRIENFKSDIKVPQTNDFLAGKSYSELMNLAQEATEWALVRENRPNCTIIMPEISPFHWGGLIFFFEMATAFEGELLNVNTFDQPGVEGYKNYMYYKLGKPNISEGIAEVIKKNPLVKREKLII